MCTVVLVQKNGLVRTMLHRVLEEHGFEVVVATPAVVPAAGPMSLSRVYVADAAGEAAGVIERAISATPGRWLVRVLADDPTTLADVLAAGASGLYSSSTDEAEIVDAVRQLARGRGWLAPDLVPAVLRDYLPYYRRRRAARLRLDALGGRDLRLLALVADGLSNASIAAELHLAVPTVKDYVSTLLARIGVTRAEAIALAIAADIAAASFGDEVTAPKTRGRRWGSVRRPRPPRA